MGTDTTVKYPTELRDGAIAVINALRVGTGWELPTDDDARLTFIYAPDLGAEEYELTVSDRVQIRASTPAGAFYGGQTLRQLFPTSVYRSVGAMESVDLPTLQIHDAPGITTGE